MIQESFFFDEEVPLEKNIVMVSDPRWKECVEKLSESKAFGIDLEAYGDALNPREGIIRLIQVGLLSGEAMVVDLGGWRDDREKIAKQYKDFFKVLLRLLPDKSVVKLGQNLKFDQAYFLWKYGTPFRNIRDTMLMSQTLWAIGGKCQKYSHNLGAIAERLGLHVSKELQMSDWGFNLTNAQYNYAALDSISVIQIASELKKRLIEVDLWDTAMVENLACPAFAEMEFRGMPVDEEMLKTQISAYTQASEEAIRPFLEEFPDVNPKSSTQVPKALNDRYNLGLSLPGKTSEADNKMILFENNNLPCVSSLLLFRSLNTQVSTYFKGVSDAYYEGFARSSYTQIAEKGTGRSSSRRPNLQNAANLAPQWKALGLKHPRLVFKAPAGYKLIITDLSQAHARIACEFSHDQVMTDAYRDGRDVHAITASYQASVRGLGSDWTPENILKWRKDPSHPNHVQAETLRKTSKNVNYGSVNAQGAATLQSTMATSRDPVFVDLEECDKMIKAWRELYSGLSKAHRTIFENANSYDVVLPGLPGTYGVTVGLSKRRVHFLKFRQKSGLDSYMGVKYADAISSIWLGTEAYIVKKAMAMILAEMDSHPEWDWHMGNMAHDEIDTWVKEEYAEEAARIQNRIMDECMAQWIVSIPVNEKDHDSLSSICDTWAEK